MKQISAQSSAPEGNALTQLMHSLTLKELNKEPVQKELKIKSVKAEQGVILSNNSAFNHKKHGRFDFLIETDFGKTIGIEVLTRPTQGKLKNKLLYAEQTDEFIFVLPKNALGLYRKPKKKVFHSQCREKLLSHEFSSPNIFAWLLDTGKKEFTEKGRFGKLFNVKQ